MGSEHAELIRFFAFGLVWLFPVALLIVVFGFNHRPRQDEAEDLGPNVVRLPVPKVTESGENMNEENLRKLLAFREPKR